MDDSESKSEDKPTEAGDAKPELKEAAAAETDTEKSESAESKTTEESKSTEDKTEEVKPAAADKIEESKSAAEEKMDDDTAAAEEGGEEKGEEEEESADDEEGSADDGAGSSQENKRTHEKLWCTKVNDKNFLVLIYLCRCSLILLGEQKSTIRTLSEY